MTIDPEMSQTPAPFELGAPVPELEVHRLDSPTPFLRRGRRWESVVQYLEDSPEAVRRYADGSLRLDGRDAVVSRYSQHPALYLHLWQLTEREREQLAQDTGPAREGVAEGLRRLSTHLELRLGGLRTLAEVTAAASGNEAERLQAAGHVLCPDDVITVLAGDASADVRRVVCERPAADAATLATDEDRFVRRLVARRPDLDATACELLADDPDIGVRFGLSKNRACPATALWRLADDSSSLVRGAAQRSLERGCYDDPSLVRDPYRVLFRVEWDLFTFRLTPNPFRLSSPRVALKDLPLPGSLVVRLSTATRRARALRRRSDHLGAPVPHDAPALDAALDDVVAAWSPYWSYSGPQTTPT